MRFDDFDKIMRKYEENIDQYILSDMYMIVRLDGRAFTKFTKAAKFEKPFDEKFRDLMVNTTEFLMKNSGFKIIYGYTESDEISLLFDISDNTFNRKVRKINTTLAGEASAYFTKQLIKENIIKNLTDDTIVSFDCRIIPIPNFDRVLDYFVWRQEDSHRNSLNGYCYWTARKEGLSKGEATKLIERRGNDFKNEMLFKKGINFNDTPTWHRRGVALYNKKVEKVGVNKLTGEKTITTRNSIFKDYELEIGEAYKEYIRNIVKEGTY